MNSTHTTVGVGATSAMAALTTLLTGWNGLDGTKAAAVAWLVVTGSGAVFGLVAWWVQWKYPSAPTLPVEVDLPAAIPVAPAGVPPRSVNPPSAALVGPAGQPLAQGQNA